MVVVVVLLLLLVLVVVVMEVVATRPSSRTYRHERNVKRKKLNMTARVTTSRYAGHQNTSV